MTMAYDKFKKKQAAKKKTIQALLDLHANPDPEMAFALGLAKKGKQKRRGRDES